jgi:hypothetical protein
MKNILTIVAFFAVATIYAEKIIYIIPPGGYEHGKLFDLSDQKLNRDNCIKHFYDLKQALTVLGYTLKTATVKDDMSNTEYILTSGITPTLVQALKKYPTAKVIAFIWEPSTIEPKSYDRSLHDRFEKIFIMDDSFVDNNKYVKLHYPHPCLTMTTEAQPFTTKKLCTLISSYRNIRPSAYELFSERKRAIAFFARYPEDFVFYGKGWDKSVYKNYGGPITKKIDVLKQCKFCLCYENTSNMNGYITEKIFDCFQAGCVPVYLGAPNIDSCIPNNCFIDFKKFRNYQELYQYLKTMQEDEYNGYIRNIQLFLDSLQAFKFSFPYFIDQVLSVLMPEYDRKIVFDDITITKLAQCRDNLAKN